MIVVLEGINGVGKSTQLHRVGEALRDSDRRVHLFIDPGVDEADPAYGLIKPLATTQAWSSVVTRMLLYMAARSELIARISGFTDKQLRDDIFLIDRYTASFFAYGELAVTRHFEGASADNPACGRQWLNALLQLCRAFVPDLTIVLTLDAATALQRLPGTTRDVYEQHDSLRRVGHWFCQLVHDFKTSPLRLRATLPFVGHEIVGVDCNGLGEDEVTGTLTEIIDERYGALSR